MYVFVHRGPDDLMFKCSFQTAMPSLKTRTEWCHSRRSSARTTPPSRGPVSGEPAGQPGDMEELTCTYAPAGVAGFLHMDVKGIEERDIKLSLKKKKKIKESETCIHCRCSWALCFLWSEVLQGSPSACWRERLQSLRSIAITLFNLKSIVIKVKKALCREFIVVKDCQSSRLNNLPRTSEN